MGNYVKIEELTDYKKVNDFLDYGWNLINTYVVRNKETNSDIITYVLGWDSSAYAFLVTDDDLSPRYPGVHEKLERIDPSFADFNKNE